MDFDNSDAKLRHVYDNVEVIYGGIHIRESETTAIRFPKLRMVYQTSVSKFSRKLFMKLEFQI